MLHDIYSKVLKLHYTIIYNYIIYDLREFNTYFISKTKVFLQ